MNQLTLRYEYDASYFNPKLSRDDFGRLSIAVETERFAGRGGFWVQWQDVREFGESLGAYPIGVDEPISVQWGYDMQEGDDLILQIEIAPLKKTGDLRVRVEIADDHEPTQRVRASFVTNYPDLAAFQTEIAKLMDREAESAVLCGRTG